MNTEQDQVINTLAEEFYKTARSHGFHDKDAKKSVEDNYATWTANLHGEVSELWEWVRKNKLHYLCDKGIPLTCEEEELADIVIRAFDTSIARGIDIGRAIRLKSEYNKTRPFMHGKVC